MPVVISYDLLNGPLSSLKISQEVTRSVRFCLSYDFLKGIFLPLKDIILMKNCIVVMMSQSPTKVLCNMVTSVIIKIQRFHVSVTCYVFKLELAQT